MHRILIVDNHGVYRKGLRVALEPHLPGCHFLEADSLQVARKEFDPDGVLDLVLVDVDAPEVSPDSIRSLREAYPKTRILAMSATTSRTSILDSLESGSSGFVSKSQPDDEIIAAIKDILSGRIYVPVMLSQVDGPSISTGAIRNNYPASPWTVRSIDPERQRLTPRQREILPLLAKGMSNKEIARALNIAEGTTKIHASGLLRVLGVRNRTEAAAAARDYIGWDGLVMAQTVELDRRRASRRR